MNIDSINKFYDARAQYIALSKEIEALVDELDLMKAEVNIALKDTVDNGYIEYKKSRFHSNAVQNFIKQACDLMFTKLDASIKDGLEVVSITVPTTGVYLWTKKDWGLKPCASVLLDFCDTATGMRFRVSVPVKSVANTNIVDWRHETSALYVVLAYNEQSQIYQTISRSFDPSSVGEAVKAFLEHKSTDMYICDVKCQPGESALDVLEMMKLLHGDDDVDDYYN